MKPVMIRRYRRDARSMDEDEELWFNDDDDDEDGEAVERRMDEDFSDSYEKFMEAKKGNLLNCGCFRHPENFVLSSRITTWSSSVTAGAANGANGANNGKSAAIPPASPAVTSSNSSSASVKTVALPATPVVKVTKRHKCGLLSSKKKCKCLFLNLFKACRHFVSVFSLFFF